MMPIKEAANCGIRDPRLYKKLVVDRKVTG
jgi:hypothetical protein